MSLRNSLKNEKRRRKKRRRRKEKRKRNDLYFIKIKYEIIKNFNLNL